MLVTRARTLVRFAHYYGKRWQSSLPPLPAQEEWKKIFHSQGPQLRDRVYVRNPVTAAELADAFVPEGERDRVIVEAFPGEFHNPTHLMCIFTECHVFRSWGSYSRSA
jgi:hypothetical protein